MKKIFEPSARGLNKKTMPTAEQLAAQFATAHDNFSQVAPAPAVAPNEPGV